ncbi:TrkH family potassium uptake protein [Iamia majanohamensis]|uniref:TrkH family potassium uptake protein n=1 Tax=Iamia majanohamensis TaxID=467976 RepID=A0AAE9Y7P8_9ACTN|nr:TrkH family potassium uptake protein [Iamia majanohamensis]WCO68067.1 TrkH family potassium uptake protein [Iamia majanohamensis]
MSGSQPRGVVSPRRPVLLVAKELRDRVELPKLGTSLPIHVAGLSVAVVGLGILISAVVESVVAGPDVAALWLLGLASTVVGLLAWQLTSIPKPVRVLDVFITVTVAWSTMAVAGALPYLVTGHFDSVIDALFESVSGFTTTGATVTADIPATSRGLLMWRSTTQWIGGMGVIVLVVAVLPTVGAGGMSLLQAEAPGPTGERLTPRVRETAKRLWGVYIGLTVIMAVAYVVAGMSVFDGVNHSFTTVSTGGFSPHQASLGHFDSTAVEWVAVVGMVLAGGNFTLYYRALRRNPQPLLRSTELRLYLAVVAGVGLWCFLVAGSGDGSSAGFRDAMFMATSTVTTTGYVTSEYGQWSQAAQAMLLMVLPIGAMAGSTAGGVKIIRVLSAASFTHREALKQLHPRLVRSVRLGRGGVLPEDVAGRVVAFMMLSLVIFGGGALLIAASGSGMITSFSASATALGNVGPGFGDLDHGGDFRVIHPFGRLVAMVQMVLGRLEIYPVILALSVVTLRAPNAARRLRERA